MTMTPRFLLNFFPIIQTHSFVSQNTFSNAGGVGCFVRNDLTFTVLSEFSCTTADYDALWIEIVMATILFVVSFIDTLR